MASAFPSFRRDSRVSLVNDQPEIVSSQELPVEENTIAAKNRQKRAVVIVTSTVTSYVFKTTTSIRSFTLAGGPSLFCLPVGFTVC